ncbi:phosphate-import protein PhnD precursor [bacterium BMS3Abin02]|nr:phosphate-import protein PhnD precursor [bacterium BMS3Abin02]GBE22329.1 phosphate-import protein PhnD precursor [bacterium BMS3Bbin01]HDH24887.1 phosphate/phosphite/phosphonate ABC transporter substrate-binding protein [Actinomycetota bacterium]HDK46103.1 phosphate/phosphite/phosphonate ABC transporter substrate-binding protein [Actinomycetota bacterium]
MKVRIALVTILSILLAACATPGASQLPFVDFAQRQPIPPAGGGQVKPLRIAVAAILSPEGNIENYGALADYLSSKLERPVEIVQRRTYQEINDLLKSGEVDVGFVCTSAYVAGHDQFGLRLLVAPEIEDRTVYYSELIVPYDSTAKDMSDLRGVVFAFTDPISTTGRIYPTYLVEQLGETPETFFARTFFTYSHDRAIKAVAAGVADAAGVDSLVLDYALRRDPNLASQIKVIDRSPAFTIPPVVVSPDVSPRQAAELRDLLLSISTDPAGVTVLAALGIDGFVPIADSAYDGVREVIDAVEQTP